MSVGLAPPQASKSPLLWMERKGEEGGRQSEWGLPRSSPSACFSPLTKVLGHATLCGHLLPDGSRACSLTLPCPLTPVMGSEARSRFRCRGAGVLGAHLGCCEPRADGPKEWKPGGHHCYCFLKGVPAETLAVWGQLRLG